MYQQQMNQSQMNQQGLGQNQQNPQNYQVQANPQSRNNQHCQLTDQDLLNMVLAELRRISSEYTTAILEASSPSVRENFYSLLDRTLQDQELVYTMMENMNMLGQQSTVSQK
ncbi:MAG TPA: spore coat protein, partial [Bacilli bacterium]